MLTAESFRRDLTVDPCPTEADPTKTYAVFGSSPTDISPSRFPGVQIARAVDLADMTVSWGPRVTSNSDFLWYYYGGGPDQQTLSAGYPLPKSSVDPTHGDPLKHAFWLEQDPGSCTNRYDYCTK